ncbi:hypothetical protein L7F22_048901 [Adiantum nelumboides]|nr:hypothetical protein [Adiantum nelumboides]
MAEKDMPHHFWAQAINTGVYIMNRTPTDDVHGVTPEEKYSGKKLDLSHLKVFGCIADVKDNIGADVKEHVDASSGNQESHTLSGSRESSSSGSVDRPWSGRLRTQVTPQSAPQVSCKGKEKVDESPCMTSVPSGSSHIDTDSDGSDQSLDEEFGIPPVRTPGPRRSNRVRFPVERLTYDGYVTNHYAYMAKVFQDVEPTCFEDAIGNENWKNAMDEEMAELDVNQTWELVPLPGDKKAIGCKWVYKVKHKADGTIEIYKARLVAKGYAQTYGIDYEETFAPVAKMATIRTLIVVATAKGWFMHQMDVKNAFLQGELQEEVYVEQPLVMKMGPVQRKLNKRQRAKKKLNVQILKELKAFECSFVQRKEDTHTSLEAIKLFLLNSPLEIQEHIIDRIADTGTVWRTGLTLHICGIRFQRGSTLNDKKAIQLACHLGLVNTVRLIPYLIEVYDDKPSWGVARTISRLSRWTHCLIRSVVPRTIPIVLEEEDKDIVKAQRVRADWYDMYEKKYNLLQPKPLCDEDGWLL